MDINFNLWCNSGLKILMLRLRKCVCVCVGFCVAAHCALHCFVCSRICCYVGARAAVAFLLEMSVISAPICAETLSDDNKASSPLVLHCCSHPLPFPVAAPPFLRSPSISVPAQDEIAPRRMSTIPSDSQSADCWPRLPPHHCGKNAATRLGFQVPGFEVCA